MNFVTAFNDGKAGKNTGLPTGLHTLDRAIDRVQRGAIYGIAASPKVGKSTFADFAFLINPYLYSEEKNIDVQFIYYSLEMSRIKIEYKVACYFFWKDYNIASFRYNGRFEGGNSVPISPRYLLHKLRDDDNNLIPVKEEHQNMLVDIYERRIKPMFGEYNAHGGQVTPGKVTVIEDRTSSNPTGIFNYLMNIARSNGQFIMQPYMTDENGVQVARERISGYQPNNPDKFTIVITDHIRKLKLEQKFTLKQNMDKMLEYQVFLRNICNFTFVDIMHLNRSISDMNRIRFVGENIHPDSSDLKDSGNLAEECDFLLTMFDPHDKRYNLHTHMGKNIEEYPNYRSIHLVDSRDTPCPAHMQCNMYAGISIFEPI